MGAPTAALGASGPWLFSRRLDLAAFLGSALLSLLLVALGIPLGLVDGEGAESETPEWAWLFVVVAVDVAHVWGNLLLVYTDPVEFRRHRRLWLFLPVSVFVLGLALVSEGEVLFWRALAALAVWHFVRQQVGWLKLYRAKNGELSGPRWTRIVDEGVVYGATLAPIVWWHANLPRPFWWLAPGDFFVALPHEAGSVALAAEALVLLAYLGRSAAAWRQKRGNPGKDILVGTTALLWWLGIVALQSDYAFTVTNVLIHGIPYAVLIAVTAQRRERAGVSIAWPLRHGAAVIIIALLFCAGVEEVLWDRLVWNERSWLDFLPAIEWARPFFVALLALPQATHYLLDAFLWRRRGNPYLV